MKVLSKYIEALKLGAQIDVKAPPGGTKAGQLVLLPAFQTAKVNNLVATSTSLTGYVNDTLGGVFVVAGVAISFGTTCTSGTLQIEVATGTQAVGSGTNQLTAVVSLAGAANTALNGVVIATPTAIVAGARVNVILAGVLTGLANCSVNIVLQRTA